MGILHGTPCQAGRTVTYLNKGIKDICVEASILIWRKRYYRNWRRVTVFRTFYPHCALCVVQRAFERHLPTSTAGIKKKGRVSDERSIHRNHGHGVDCVRVCTISH